MPRGARLRNGDTGQQQRWDAGKHLAEQLAASAAESVEVCTGQERRLIYPSREADARGGSDAATTSFEEGWDPERWGEATMACDFQDTEALAPPAAPPAPLAPRDVGSLPSSPGELLRYLASDEHKAEKRAFQRLVASSYEVRFSSTSWYVAQWLPGRGALSTADGGSCATSPSLPPSPAARSIVNYVLCQ